MGFRGPQVQILSPRPSSLLGTTSQAGRSGLRHTGDLLRLKDPDGVAGGVADAHVGAVEVVGGLLGEVGDAALLESLVQTPDVVRDEDDAAHGPLADQLAELRSGGFVLRRRGPVLHGDVGARVAGGAGRQATGSAAV